MGQALYRKYRSQKLDEIVGQEHITTTLSNALKNGSISHAYLFTGPRGVGKTSIARIIAHEVNGLPYDEETTHLDIIEIDAASNRRIDEIRELREKVHNTPTSAKYKVYIIDEVHMLTREAFNALLKTLEEPPEHAIFILATTEAHKVPETIISRTQRFTFRPIDKAKTVDHLEFIAKKEDIKISREALELIADHSGGSFRDSISLLDQVKSTDKKVTLADVQHMLGIAPDEAISELLEIIIRGDTQALIENLQSLRQTGFQAPQIAHQLSEKLRLQLQNGTSPWSPTQITKLLEKLLNVSASHNPPALLELLLLQETLSHSPTPQVSEPVDVIAQPPTQKLSSEKNVTKQNTAKPTSTDSLDEESWQQVLQALKRQHNTLYGIVRMAVPEFYKNNVTLRFAFPFHKKRLEEERNQQMLSSIIQKQTGLEISIDSIVDKNIAAPELPPVEIKETMSTPDPLDAISNIFGGGEVIE